MAAVTKGATSVVSASRLPHAPHGAVVVLAPACSSFDMFTDYAERGGAFKTEVVRLQEEHRSV